MHGTGTSGCQYGIAPGILTVLCQVHARGIGHVLVDKIVDAPSKTRYREARLLRQRLHDRFCRGEVYGHATADEVAGIEIAKQEVGVRDGRSPPPAAISGWARLRTGARRANFQETDVVELCDRTAARTDLDQLQGRDTHGQTTALDEAPFTCHLEAVGNFWLAVIDDAKFGGRAPHIEGQDLRAAIACAEV